MTVDLDDMARAAVLLQLSLAHDHFVAEERSERRKGHEAAAEGAHRVSIWLLRAYAAERDNVPPAQPRGQPPLRELPPWSA